ncbi:MAG: MoaD/ThiS family protein [Proteobacteria bacterium]|nr:MoaD/ThiS family protein [Pseudomonadota bacterium]
MPKVIVPPPYQGPTLGQAEVDVSAQTVRGAMLAVDSRFPGFAAQIFDGAGAMHRFVKLFRNGEQVDPGDVDQALADDDTVEVVAAIAGG